MSSLVIVAILLFIALAAFVAAFLVISSKKQKGRVSRALNMSLFLITLPKKNESDDGQKQKDEKEIIAVMEQLYASLSNVKAKKNTFIYGPPYLAFEISTPEKGEEISFYIAVPRSYEDVIEKQIHGFYPSASVEKTEDYNIFSPDGVAAGAFLKQSKSYALPINTYQNLEADPLNGLTNTLSKLAHTGEGAAIQMVFRPISGKWQSLGKKIAREMQSGKSFSQAKSEATKGTVAKTAQEFSKASKTNEDEIAKPKETQPMTPGQEEIIKALEIKSSKVGFETNIRLLVSAKDQERADQILSQMEGAFVQFEASDLNSLKILKTKGAALKKLIYNFSFRLFNKKQSSIFNTEELTSLFHFPTASTATPKVKFLNAKAAAPPADLPNEGIILGRNIYRGQESVVRLQKNDRRRHLYVIGQTGTGKTTLLKNMMIQDIQNGEGMCFIDPHGGDLEDIMGQIPKERAEDVIVFDPADLERPMSLNMLQYDPQYPEQKTFIVNELISIFDKLYDLKISGGPMFEQYTRNALQLLMDDPLEKFTIMEVPKVLADKEFRTKLLNKCKNIVVKDFWEKEAEKAGGEQSLQNIVPYITSKFNVFIANDYMRPIIGQAENSLDFRKIMDEKKILLVNLSKGRLGDINSSLLGLIITGKLLMAAFSRIDIPEDQRNDFYLYIDEFQNFTTDSISTILSEARKYKLCLNIAHQYIGQLEDKIRDAVFGNVGSIATFRIGPEDADFLVKQFEPVFDASDLINIDNYNAYLKLLINSKTSQPFNIIADPPQQKDEAVAQVIKELSRLKFGRDRDQVEKEILERSRLSQPVNAEPFIDGDIR